MFHVKLAPLGGILGPLLNLNLKTQKTRFCNWDPNKISWSLVYEVLLMSSITLTNPANGCFPSRSSRSTEGCLVSVGCILQCVYLLQDLIYLGMFPNGRPVQPRHDCKGANKSSRIKWLLYIQHGQIFTQWRKWISYGGISQVFYGAVKSARVHWKEIQT